MALGYDQPLYVLAFDHRGSFERDLFQAKAPVGPEVHADIEDAKRVIGDAFAPAVARGAPKGAAGILTDEEYGSGVVKMAKQNGFVFAMPVEKSGQAEFEFEYGDDFGAHIEHFDPAFAKVLVRYNPEGDADLNARQTKRLRQLSDWLHERDRKFLYELLVPATDEQLAKCGGDQARYDRDIRPDLVVEVLRESQAAGVEPDVWKIEGLESRADCERVAQQARAGKDRGGVVCVVLGRGADENKVLFWLKTAAGVPGFNGFAVGRTIWLDALQSLCAGTSTREDTVHAIADRYLRMIEGYGS
jgi:myo-inositol catabolism protein IolC